MPSKLCFEPKCGATATYRGRCAGHARQRDRVIPRAGRQVYNTRRWLLLRRHKLLASPICERCDCVLASEVHHRVAIGDGGDVWSMSNLEALCKSCHSQATRQEQIAI